MLCSLVVGCGTVRTTHTQRTATEQLLISDAIDRTIQEINFSVLAGKSVYFDDRHLYDVVDSGYLISSLRQHLLASGVALKDERESADYIVESRAGAIGTDNHDLLFGLPATTLPQVALFPTLPPAIPEIPIAKRRDQRGVAKIAVFAYRRETGESVWQSGIVSNESKANNIWILGAGPFKKGTIYEGVSFGKAKLSRYPNNTLDKQSRKVVKISDEQVFEPRRAVVKQTPPVDKTVRPATYEALVKPLVESRASDGPEVLPPPTIAPILTKPSEFGPPVSLRQSRHQTPAGSPLERP